MAITAAALVRVWMSDIAHRRRYFPFLIVAICGVGVVVFIVMPPLPE
jgi:hypothetical protein